MDDVTRATIKRNLLACNEKEKDQIKGALHYFTICLYNSEFMGQDNQSFCFGCITFHKVPASEDTACRVYLSKQRSNNCHTYAPRNKKYAMRLPDKQCTDMFTEQLPLC